MSQPASASTPEHMPEHVPTASTTPAALPHPWQSWGPAALARAQASLQPLLLCLDPSPHAAHSPVLNAWADLPAELQQRFVPVWINPEQAPALDALYQHGHHLLRRGEPGGWPLLVFCAPGGVPFHSSVGLPEGGAAGLGDLLASVSRVWTDRRADLARQDQALLAALANSLPTPRPLAPSASDWAQAAQRAGTQLEAASDAQHPGFGPAPRFAHPVELAFWWQHAQVRGDQPTLGRIRQHLRQLAEGGLFDTLGGGFFRCSLDEAWHLPQFDKPLADNALLLALFSQACRQWPDDPLWAQVVDASTGCLLRDLTQVPGQPASGWVHGLASVDDAGHDAAHYLWDSEPLRLALSPNEWDLCAAHWGLVDAPAANGRWHLRTARPLSSLAPTLGKPEAALAALVASARSKLLGVRQARPAPLRGGPARLGASALAVAALAQAGAVRQRPDWLQAARDGFETLWTHGHPEADVWLALPSLPGLPGLPGPTALLNDLAECLHALLTLHELAPQPDDLPRAHTLASQLLARHEDPVAGGFWLTPHDDAPMFHRLKPGSDSNLPSANGRAALALLQAAQVLDWPAGRQAAQRTVQAFAQTVLDQPVHHLSLLQAALALGTATSV